MEHLFVIGIEAIKLMQDRLIDYRSTFEWLSYLGDPKLAYIVYFPLIFAFSQQCGLQVIIATSVSECANLLLKWLLQEDRPYWYIHERKDLFGDVRLKQFPITCETGPGSPSGHVMVSTALWFVVIAALSKKLNLFFSLVIKFIFFVAMCLIAASRIFIAAHFPHQCLLGLLIGLQVGHVFTKFRLMTPRSMTMSSAVLMTMTLGLYYFLQYRHETYPSATSDPNRSIHLATKWCKKPEYIHVDTTPLFSSMRYTGTIIGCAFGLWGNHKGQTWGARRNTRISLAMAALALGLGQIYAHIGYPADPTWLYVTCFCVTAVLFNGYICLVPQIVAKIFPPPRAVVNSKQKNK